jgi:hypothetical protein
MRKLSVPIAIVLLFIVAGLVGAADEPAAKPAAPATAPTLELELARLSLKNVDDDAGRWQFEGGKVLQKGEHVANYASTKRVVNQGTEEQNTAMLTVTIFFLGNKPPENITLQGAHDFNSGDQTGSVSAASKAYLPYVGKSFVSKGGKVTKVTIN